MNHPDSTHRVSMGAGADRLYLQNLGRGEGTSYAGGRSLGDRVELTAGRGNAVLDMPGRMFDLVQPGVRGRTRIVGFEHVDVEATRVSISGDRHANRLRAAACRSVLRGGAGRDLLDARGTNFSEGVYCGGFRVQASTRILGGPGSDRMYGTRGPDVLLGGTGFDRAWGNRGRDRCRAEFRRGCELR